MIVLTRSQFLDIPKKNGVFVYLNGESCKLCENYLKEVSEFKHTRFYQSLKVILLRDEDRHWMFTQRQVLSTPCTRIYFNDEYVYQQGGVLYSTQIKEFEDKLLEWNL